MEVFEALRSLRVELAAATARTALAAISGLAISTALGTFTAFAFAQSSLVRRAFYPYAILFQTVPVIAIAPLIILAFGRGFHSVTLVASVISVFPVVTNTTTGLLQIDNQLHELFRLHGASWWQTLWKLRLPSALPWMITGIRIASGSKRLLEQSWGNSLWVPVNQVWGPGFNVRQPVLIFRRCMQQLSLRHYWALSSLRC